MEFKSTNNEGSPITTINTVVTSDIVTLTSSSRPSINTIDGMLSIGTESTTAGVVVDFDAKEVVDQLDETTISTKLLTVYGANGRLYATTRDVESVLIRQTDLPARLDYTIITNDGSTEREYNATYNVGNITGSSKVLVSGKQNNTTQTLTIPSAVESLDKEVTSIKNNLEKISYFHDKSQKKDVTLHNMITNMVSSIDKLTADINALKEKTKDL
jgi:hypothetical protein